MRAAAILGLGCSLKNLAPFQRDDSIEWRVGMPSDSSTVDAIVLLGGDGTVHRHLGQLVKLGLPVLVMPVGSGNDFARALGVRSVRDALAAWRKFCRGVSNLRTVDLGSIRPLGIAVADVDFTQEAGGAPGPHLRPEARYFCCVAGVGIDAEVSRRANRLPRWLRGHGGYTLSLLPAMGSVHAGESEDSNTRRKYFDCVRSYLDHAQRPVDDSCRFRQHSDLRRRHEDCALRKNG